jgi:ABC-type polar amino acid transport system ATPase subunit
MLAIDNLDAGYRHVRVLHDVSLAVAAGEAVGVLGPNGAGKSTLLRAIAGTCTLYGGRIVFAGQPLDGKPDHARAAIGIAHVPEGRRIWPSLTVEENLLLGAWRLPRAARNREASQLLDYVIDLFPRLRERMRARAAVLSGGEQQMLAIGRGLMAKPPAAEPGSGDHPGRAANPGSARTVQPHLYPQPRPHAGQRAAPRGVDARGNRGRLFRRPLTDAFLRLRKQGRAGRWPLPSSPASAQPLPPRAAWCGRAPA